jgi:hypothetical protein
LLFFPILDIFEEKTNKNERFLRDTSNPNDFNFIFYSFIFIDKKNQMKISHKINKFYFFLKSNIRIKIIFFFKLCLFRILYCLILITIQIIIHKGFNFIFITPIWNPPASGDQIRVSRIEKFCTKSYKVC